MKYKIALIALIILAQIALILGLSLWREHERDTAETFLLRCRSTSWVGKNYYPVTLEIADEEIPLSDLPADLFEPEVWESMKKEVADRIKNAPKYSWDFYYHFSKKTYIYLTLKLDGNGGASIVGFSREQPSRECAEGEVVLPVELRSVRWEDELFDDPEKDQKFKENFDAGTLSFKMVGDLRFYMSEKRAREIEALEKSPSVVAELFLHSDGSLGIKNLIVNGFPEKK
ncbi:MAG: hypothetical protein K6B46_01875 [Opitutales bacterium]|nr:hypothetical protein [Opitutales bacterium]